MEKETLRFESTRKFSERGIIPEAATRRLIKEGKVPGFYSGTKFLINTNAFIQLLENSGNVNGLKGENIHV